MSASWQPLRQSDRRSETRSRQSAERRSTGRPNRRWRHGPNLQYRFEKLNTSYVARIWAVQVRPVAYDEPTGSLRRDAVLACDDHLAIKPERKTAAIIYVDKTSRTICRYSNTLTRRKAGTIRLHTSDSHVVPFLVFHRMRPLWACRSGNDAHHVTT